MDVPSSILFLPTESGGAPEENLYGTSVILNVAPRYRTANYSEMMLREFDRRIDLVQDLMMQLDKRHLDISVKFNGAKEIWKELVLGGYSMGGTPNIGSWFLLATHSRRSFVQYEGVVNEIVQEMQAVARNNDADAFIRLFQEILSMMQTDEDLMLNSIKLGQIVSYLFQAEEYQYLYDFVQGWNQSHANLQRHKQSIVKGLKERWRHEQPDFNAAFPIRLGSDGFATRQVVKGTRFYRGNPIQLKNGKMETRPAQPRRGTAWFGMDSFTTLPYITTYLQATTLKDTYAYMGQISVFETKKTFKLIDMSDVATLDKVRKSIRDPYLLNDLEEAWSVKGKDKVERSSNLRADIRIVEWLCEHGFDGYIAPEMGNFHAELFLCRWYDYLQLRTVHDALDVIRADFASDFYARRAKNIAVFTSSK